MLCCGVGVCEDLQTPPPMGVVHAWIFTHSSGIFGVKLHTVFDNWHMNCKNTELQHMKDGL